jgi:hypothetical protein
VTLSIITHTMLLPVIAGLVVGFCAGVITGVLATLRWVAHRRTPGKPLPGDSDADVPDADHRPWHGGRDHLSRLGIALALLGMVALVASVVAIVQNNATAHCLADFNAAFAAAQRERADAADLDRQAIRQQRAVTREFNQVMIAAVTNPIPATDPAAQQKARDNFLVKARGWDTRLAEVDRLDRDAEAQRRQNPLPVQPDC